MALSRIALAVSLAYLPGAQAAEFTTQDGVQVNWTTHSSMGQARRAANPDPRLLNANNAILLGITGATGGNTDDSDLNYPKGKPFTTLLNLSSELGLRKDSFGAVLGIRAWKDYTLRDQSVPHGSFDNRYQANTPLNDIGFEDYAGFSNIVLMNAYAYNNFPVGGGNLKVTAGRHVLNWGNDLFIQGMNQINAIDLNAARAPGLDVNDIRLPQGMLSAKFDMDKGKSFEAFYQFQYQNNVFPGCGTYFQTTDASIGPNTQNACASAFVQAKPGTGDAGGMAEGLYIPATTTRMPGGGGQYGASAHFQVDAISTDVGLYAMTINSRTPMLSAIKGNSPFPGTTPLLGPGGAQSYLFWEYPKNVNVFGISGTSKFSGWVVGSELTYTPNYPVQLSVGDLVAGVVNTSDPAILSALLQKQGVPAAAAPAIAGLMNANAGPLGSRFAASANGGDVPGYDRVRKTQLQLNAVRGFSDIAGAKLLTVGGEAGFQWSSVPGNTDGLRYGRGFVFGVANSPTYNTAAYTALPGALGAVGNAVTQGGACPLLNATGQAGCANQGFVSPFSWGLRFRAQLSYPAVFGSNVTLKPTLFISSDLKGYSADGQFNEGRTITALSLIAEVGKHWTAQVGYTGYNRSAAWDPLRDRGYYSASLRLSF